MKIATAAATAAAIMTEYESIISSTNRQDDAVYLICWRENIYGKSGPMELANHRFVVSGSTITCVPISDPGNSFIATSAYLYCLLSGVTDHWDRLNSLYTARGMSDNTSPSWTDMRTATKMVHEIAMKAPLGSTPVMQWFETAGANYMATKDPLCPNKNAYADSVADLYETCELLRMDIDLIKNFVFFLSSVYEKLPRAAMANTLVKNLGLISPIITETSALVGANERTRYGDNQTVSIKEYMRLQAWTTLDIIAQSIIHIGAPPSVENDDDLKGLPEAVKKFLASRDAHGTLLSGQELIDYAVSLAHSLTYEQHKKLVDLRLVGQDFPKSEIPSLV
jgi:hypothetical protein